MLGSTITFWKRRSRAPSFSICFRYSSRVVAPIHWIPPRASAGFIILAASMLPLPPPAPTIVWISSIYIMILLLASSSSRIPLTRSSNCPRYFVPATKPDKSSSRSFFPIRWAGTSPETILWASPSTRLVFPTPGSPMRIGLLFLLLPSI